MVTLSSGRGIKGEGELALPKGSIAIRYQLSTINSVAVLRSVKIVLAYGRHIGLQTSLALL